MTAGEALAAETEAGFTPTAPPLPPAAPARPAAEPAEAGVRRGS
jgi:hypothetical protein